MFGHKLSEESKRKIVESKIGVCRSKSSVDKQRNTLQTEPWRNSHADKNIWYNADKLYSAFIENPEFGAINFSKKVGMSTSKVASILKKFKNGWVPTEDSFWIAFKNNHKEDECQSINY